jgi:drug/metabolite transporter (DMT)-like permease
VLTIILGAIILKEKVNLMIVLGALIMSIGAILITLG